MTHSSTEQSTASIGQAVVPIKPSLGLSNNMKPTWQVIVDVVALLILAAAAISHFEGARAGSMLARPAVN